MAGIKKNTKANKTNKNVKTAKNTSSRERAHKEEKKSTKKSSSKTTAKKSLNTDEKLGIGKIVLPTARDKTAFTNNGIMKKHNEAQQSMFRNRPASNGGVSYKDFVKDKKTYQFTPDRTADVPNDNTPRYAKIGSQRKELAKEEATKITHKDNPLAGLGTKNSQTRMTPMQQQKYDAGKQEAQGNIEYIKQNWNALNDADKQNYALYAVYNQGINDQTRDLFTDAYKNASGQNKINLLSAAVYYNGYDDEVNNYVKQLSSEDKKTLEKTLTASMYGEYNEENYQKGKSDLTKYYEALKVQKENQFERDYAKEHNYGPIDYLREHVLESIGSTSAGINSYAGMGAADISKADRKVTAPWKGVDLLNNDPITNITAVAKNFVNFALAGVEKAFKNDTETFYKLTHGGENISDESLAKISEKIENWGTHVSDDYWNDVYLTEVKGADAGVSDRVKFAGQVIDGIGGMVPSIIISLINPAAGAAGLATLGTSAAGQYAKQAYDTGASLEDAVTYGTVMGIGEAATERMFTGFGYFGKGAVSTIGKRTGVQLLSPTTRQTLEYFGNSMGGKILKRLAAGGGEATEEAVMQLVQPFIQRATYDENAANATWQEIAAAGGLGFVVAEILGVPATALGVYSTKSGESKFLNQFQEGLKEGGLSEREINTVMQQAKRVTKGKGTIASNESQVKETSVTSNLSEVTNSIDEATAKLKEKAKNMEVGDVVSVAVVTDEGVKTLTATVRENGLPSMPTYTDTLDAKEYKNKAKQLENARNTAEKTGVQLNVSPSIIESVSAIENATGTEIVFEDNARKNENGRYENGKIYVNINSRNPVAQIVAHELTHTLSSTSSYGKLQELVFNYYKDSVGYKQDDVLELYESNGVKLNSIEDVNEEVMAIFVEKKLLTDFDTIKTVTKDKSLARKIIDWLNNMIQKLTGTKEQKFFVDARNMYKKALTEKTSETKGAKYSLAEADEKYLAAVESGDMETAQKMVDEAARINGFTEKLYHGTPNGTYTEFKDWQYFTINKKYADIYQNQGASSNGYKVTAKNPKTYAVYVKSKNPFDTRNVKERNIFEEEFYQKWGNGAPLSDKGLPDWTDGDDFVEFFDDSGYDYDMILLDEGGTGGYGDDVKSRGISYVIKKSAQIKSADPVTYDDNGEVIPLSQRFDITKKDIRYSISEKTDADKEIDAEMKKRNLPGFLDSFFLNFSPKSNAKTLIDKYNFMLADSIPDDITVEQYYNEILSRPSYNYNYSMYLQKNLYESKWKWLSPYQAEYFANSKVRDDEGRLLAVSHGTKSGLFSIFDTVSKSDLGSHFGTHEAAASFAYRDYPGESEIYEVFLNIENPLTMPDVFYGGYMAAYRYLKKNMNTGSFIENKTWENLDAMANEKKEGDRNTEERKEFTKLTADYIKSLGYDGIEYINQVEDAGSKSYIIFDSKQVKRIDNIHPTESKDIRYSISENERNPFEEELDGISAEGIFENYFKGKDGNIKYGGKKATDEVITAMRFASELTAGIENHFSVIDNKRKISNMIKNVAMNIYLGKGFTENDVIKITKAAYENSGENIEIEDGIKAAKKELRNLKIYIPKDVRGEVNDLGGIVALNKKGISNKTSFTFTKGNDSISLDDMRDILLNSYPDVFSDSLGVEEILQVISITPKKKMKIQGDEEALREGMTEQEMKEILENEISFVRKSLQYYSENVKNRIVNAANKEVERRYKKESKKLSEAAKKTAREFSRANKITNQRYKNISAYHAKKSEQLSEKERKIYEQAQEKAYRDKLEKRKAAVLEEAKKKKSDNSISGDTRKLLYQQNSEVQNLRRGFKKDILFLLGDVEQKNSPKYVNVLLAEQEGIDKDTFYGIYADMKKIVADRKDDKVIMGSRRKKIIDYIQSLNLTAKQKKFLYLDIAGFKLSNIPTFKNGGTVKPLGNRKGRLDRAIEEMALDMYTGDFSEKQIDDFLSIYYGDESVSEFDYDTMRVNIADHVLNYSQDIAQAKENARTKIRPSMGKEKRSIKELKKSGARELKKYLLDEGEAFTRMENALKYYNLYSYYNAAKQANAVATTMLFEGGQYTFDGVYVGRSLYEIMKPILKKGDRILPGKEKDNSYLSAFEQYMFELHNMDRIIYEKPVTNSSLTESKEIVDDLLKQFPEFKDIGEEVHQFIRNLLDMSVSVGRITREDAEYFKAKYPHYVPSFRSEEIIDNNNGRIHRVHKIFKTAEGGNQTLDPLWEQIERRTREIVKELKKNELAVHLMEAFFHNPEKAKEFIFDVDTEYEDITSMEDVVDSFGYEEPKSKDNRPFIPAYVNGVRSNLYIADANILYAWDRIAIHRDEILPETFLRNFNNFKRGTLTTYNPVFTLTNGIKDLQDMFIYNKHAEKLPYYYGKAWTGIIADNTKVAQEWKRYLANGAANASIFEYDNTVGGKKKNPSKLYDKTLKHIDDVNFLVEQAPRFAVYLETKDRLTKQNEKGLNQYTKRDIEIQAMLAAADATLNFGRSGTFVKYLNTYGATFLNAGVQGMDRLVRTFKQTKGETNIQTALNVTGLVIKMAIFGIAPSLANWLIYKDDPEFEDIPDYKKMANYIFKINGEWFMIPKGRVLAWLSSLFYIPYGYKKGDYSLVEALKEELRSFTDNVAPSNPVTGSIVGVFLQMYANKDFFGYDIVPYGLENKSGYLQYDENTTELSKTITKLMHDIFTDSNGNAFFDWSALKMDYMIDQMTGILGDTFLPLFKAGTFDGTAKDILKRAIKKLINPLEKKFSIDAVMTNESASEFYDLKDELSRAKEDADGNTPDALALKYMNSRQDEITELNNQIDDIYSDKGLSDNEKEDKILKLKDELNQLYKEIYAKTKQVRDEARSSYKVGGDIDQAYAAAIRKTQGTEYYIKNFGTEGEKNKWDEVKDSGIDADTFLNAYEKINSFESDKDKNGETINGSLRKKVVDYIESLDVTAEQKEALYKAQNYSEKTMPQFSDGGVVASTAENETSVSPLGGEFRVSSNFGYRQAPTAGASTYHQGIDLACKVGTPVISLEGGKVTKVKNGGGYGLEVEVTDKNGNVVKYAHLSAAGVSVGDIVSAGEQIAKSGNSGTSTGPHLHLGYMVDGQWVNPADYFSIDGARSGGYYNDKGYQDVVTASSNSGGGGSKKSSKTTTSSTNIQSSAYNTVKNVAKTLSKEGYGSYTSVASTNEASASGKTNVKTSAPSNNYAYLPTAKTGATLPTAKGSTSTIKYNQTGTSTTATSKTSRPTYWYDSILS